MQTEVSLKKVGALSQAVPASMKLQLQHLEVSLRTGEQHHDTKTTSMGAAPGVRDGHRGFAGSRK